MVMEIIASRTAVEYFLLLGRRGSGVRPPPPPSSPPPSSSPSREGGFPPPLPRRSSIISAMSSTTVPGMTPKPRSAMLSNHESTQNYGTGSPAMKYHEEGR